MSLPRYGKYRDSGMKLLATIPAHWEIHPFKRFISFIESGVSVNAIDDPASIGEVGVLKTSCVYSGRFNPSENKTVVIEELERVACSVKEGTLIVSRMNTPELVGAAGLVYKTQENLFLPDRLWQVHLSKMIPKFAYYWTAGPLYRAQVQMACAGTSASMQNLSQEDFLRFILPMPPVAEQTAIAAFLDRETAKIDALIAEQEKLIALLTEKRQATISHAVTRGLNPDATMKDSGVAWLGEVPAHWEVIKGSRIGTLFGSGPVSEDEVQEEGYVPFIKVGSLSSEGFDVAHWSWYVSKATAERLMPYSEFVVFPKRGAAIFLNKVNIVRCQALIDPNLMGWKIRQDISNEYVAYLLSARKLHELADVSTVPQINNRHIEPEKFPIPPFSEQEVIVQFLYAECRKLDLLKSEAERVITVLKERRSALIAAAVTGQIDVRGLVEAQPN